MSAVTTNSTAALNPGGIGCSLMPACSNEARREKLRTTGTLNGIDYVEVGDDGVTLCVHLFGDIPTDIQVANVRVSGGDRITGLRVLSVNEEREPELHDDVCLRVVLDREGDHTAYCLCIVDASSGNDPASWIAYAGFDPRYACATLRFRLDCGKNLDCAASTPCVPTPQPLLEINYLAKDYASFRQLLFDRMALNLPAWQERHVPDIGVALVEVLAYTADYLSYYQDAVATEAYLGTARRRISVRRHARLVDYRMHEGCNARALVALSLAVGEATLALDNLLLLAPPVAQLNVTPGFIDASQLAAARVQGALIFEPMPLEGATSITVVAAQSAIRFYTWGDELCCLPRGSTQAVLIDAPLTTPPSPAPPAPPPSTSTVNPPTTPPASSAPPGATPSNPNDPTGTVGIAAIGAPTASVPVTPTASSKAAVAAPQRALKLQVGDILIFEEVLGPATGNPADADPTHRQAVRLTEVVELVDPLDGTLLLEISWDACDALLFDLCLSVRMPSPDCSWVQDVSLARGNVLLVDHGDHLSGQCSCAAICMPSGSDDVGNDVYPGLTSALADMPDACQRCNALAEDCWLVPGSTDYGCCQCEGAVQDVTYPPDDTGHALPGTPLTWAEPLPSQPQAPICKLIARDPRAALPQLTVYGGALADVLIDSTPAESCLWQSCQDLLESGPNDRQFVVEIDDDGAAHLRFGDGVLGQQPQAGDFFRALSRLGNGTAGNVGRDSIVWLALKSDVPPADVQARNPLPASGGTAAETLAEVKLYAPGAFSARSLRAIIADDYAMFAEQSPKLQGAACAMAWNGSNYEADVVVDPLGRESLSRSLAHSIKRDLYRYRRIGHDVAVLGANYVPLLIELFVCVLPDFLTAQVQAQLVDCFTAGSRSDGTPGFFNPDRLQLGEPVFLSALMAQAQAITGVAHVEVRTLTRMEVGESGDVPADGVLHLAASEIAQVDNDPDHPDHGSISFSMGGGR
ncbi:putative baseplate assembly protein [Rhodanobacter sp. MP7CTX1]|uniref:putative baseplate assembly protein n=1 Tax=Rhodanobacter sp. MP7CTX1 TaxID=2723084 RepID=UPI00183CE983|nr:putative baseplate assembly protein [Rhodanobacter sp. MP7CTX1]MBB6187834.1 hypothetical protein [Rhodanobacter sp. MP7CTX1]